MGVLYTLTIIIFIVLAAIHVYWAFGGQRGIEAAIPKVNGEAAFTPGPFLTFLVALILAGCALLFYSLSFGQSIKFPFKGIMPWLGGLVAFVFIARAVGDFKQVGLFKQKQDSTFAYLDSRYYSPLCLFLGSGFIYVLTITP